MTETIPGAIQKLFAEREEARAEAETLRSRLAELEGERDKATSMARTLVGDVEAATRREGPLYEALEKSWAPPSTEEPTEQEMRLATLNGSSGGTYDVGEPEPDFGTAEHISRLPQYQRAPRQEAPTPPPSPTRPRASTPTLRLTED